VFALLGSVLNHALMCDFRLRQFVSEFFYAYVAIHYSIQTLCFTVLCIISTT